MKWFKKRVPSFVEAPVHVQNNIRRAKQIENICNEHINKILPINRTADRQILIPYKDLITIWDRANLLRNDL